MLTKLLLLLSKGRKSLASPGRSGRLRRPREGSFSMAMTMLVILALILGTIALANRNTYGLLGTSLQSRNREARDAAEAGVVQIITELNKERNRRLLVSGRPPTAWNATDAEFQNPCTGFTDAFATATVQAPTARALAFQPGTWINVDGAGGKQFSVVSIEYLNHNRSAYTVPATEAVLTGEVKTLIRITVAGRVDGAEATSQARVTREFEVVPKCCKRSFGYNTASGRFFGRDKRPCHDQNNAGDGVVASLNGGTVRTSHNSFSIIDDQTPPQPVTEVLCRSDPPTPNPDCVNQQWTLGRNISVTPVDFTLDLPDYPINTTGSYDNTTPAQLAVTASQRYLRVNNSGTEVELCNASGSACTSLSQLDNGATASPVTPPNATKTADRRCKKRDPDGGGVAPEQFYCNLTKIDATNEDLVIDTSNGIINLYFDNPNATPSTTNWNYIDLGGNGTLKQVYCSGGQSDGSTCATTASIAQIERLNVFADEKGSFEVRGTGSALAMNIYAPWAAVIWRGGGSANPNFIGRIWTNDLDIRGGIAMQVVLSLPGFCNQTGVSCPPAAGTAVVDWAARSVSHSSSF